MRAATISATLDLVSEQCPVCREIEQWCWTYWSETLVKIKLIKIETQ